MPPLGGRGCWGATGAFWALQVRHVAIGQVGHKAAVGQTPPEEVHGCDRWGSLSPHKSNQERLKIQVASNREQEVWGQRSPGVLHTRSGRPRILFTCWK